MTDNDKNNWENPWPSHPKPDITPAPLNPPETEATTDGGASSSALLSGTYSLTAVKTAFSTYLVGRHVSGAWSGLSQDERQALIEMHWRRLQEALAQVVSGQGGE